MDGDFSDDLEGIIRNVSTAEIISLFFPIFRKTVLIDTRHSDAEGPMVRLLPMAASPEERIRSIRRLRPSFPRVRKLALIPWTRYVDSLVSFGVWSVIVKRFKRSGHEGVVEACGSILEELRRLEKAELAAVVMGQNYHTIWSAPR